MRRGEAEQEPFQWVFSGGRSVSGYPWVSSTAPWMLHTWHGQTRLGWPLHHTPNLLITQAPASCSPCALLP